VKNKPVDGRKRRASSVSAYLLFVAISCTVPVALFGGYFAYHFASEASAHAKADLEQRLALMRNAVDQRVEKVVAELEVLARSPDLRTGDLARFEPHAAEVTKLVGAITILLSDRQGNQLLNTRPHAPGAAIPKRQNLQALEEAWTSGKPAVSDLYTAVVDGQPVISVEVPVEVAGVRRILAAGFVSTTFSDVMNQYVPDGAIGSIIDKNGLLIARRPPGAAGDLVGTKTIPELLRHIGEPAAFWVEAYSRTGQPTYTSMLRSNLTGWSVNLALPREAVDGPLRRTILLFSMAGGIALLVGLFLAHVISERFVRAFEVLQDHVERLTLRQPSAPEEGPIAEINAMDETLYLVGDQLAQVLHRQELLLAEINHRVKNTLATVNAIARLSRTSASTVPEFVESFQDRIFALGRAYDLLTQSDWSGADLRSLVETTVAPYAHSHRVEVSGTSTILRPKFALAMAAAIQELTTNAAKYGSLSEPNGSLKVHWYTSGSGTTTFEWIEQGGPEVREPARKGFGTKLIQEMLAKDTGWEVEAKYAREGFRCVIAIKTGVSGEDEPVREAVAAK